MRILILNVPRMLRDMLKALIHQEQDVEIVGEDTGTVGSLDRLRDAVARTRPDVLLLGCAEGMQQGLG